MTELEEAKKKLSNETQVGIVDLLVKLYERNEIYPTDEIVSFICRSVIEEDSEDVLILYHSELITSIKNEGDTRVH